MTLAIRLIKNVFREVKQQLCAHEFDLGDLKFTGIPELEAPKKDASFEEWGKYFEECYKHASHTNRVIWPCVHCGKAFYAHCGLDISPDNGPVIKRREVLG